MKKLSKKFIREFISITSHRSEAKRGHHYCEKCTRKASASEKGILIWWCIVCGAWTFKGVRFGEEYKKLVREVERELDRKEKEK